MSRFSQSGLRPRFLLLADIVAKVENRTTPKISRKHIFREIWQRDRSLQSQSEAANSH
jgi:hypothetical protein